MPQSLNSKYRKNQAYNFGFFCFQRITSTWTMDSMPNNLYAPLDLEGVVVDQASKMLNWNMYQNSKPIILFALPNNVVGNFQTKSQCCIHTGCIF